MGRATTKEVVKELKKLKIQISKKNKIDKMLLFGSRARGDELLTSDVDLLVVSKDYENIPFRKRAFEFFDHWLLPVDLEVICYTPEEFNRKKKEIGLVQMAVKQGKLI